MSAKSSSRGGVSISLIGIHTNEGDNPFNVFPDRTAENLAAYLDRPTTIASYHKIVDDDSVVDYLPDNVASWSLRSGNARSLNLCMTGWAAWSREEWLRHSSMLKRAALIVRCWCVKYKIPLCKITAVQVGLDRSGICGHVDWTLGKRDGNHTDPGLHFPWDVFLNYVLEDFVISHVKSKEDELNFFELSGQGRRVIPCPTGSAAKNNREAFLSASVSEIGNTGLIDKVLGSTGSVSSGSTNPVWIQVFAQNALGGVHDWKWTEKDLAPVQTLIKRVYKPIQSGTTHLVVSWDLRSAPSGATVLLETISQ